MDINQPLPDTPLYESYRHLDPTTKTFDCQKNRTADFWFSMDYVTFLAYKHAAIKRFNHYFYRQPDPNYSATYLAEVLATEQMP